MLEKVLNKIVNIASDNTENIGKSFVRKIKSDFVRSPFKDNFTSQPKALISHEQALKNIAKAKEAKAIEGVTELFNDGLISRVPFVRICLAKDLERSSLVEKLQAKRILEKNNLLNIDIKQIDKQNKTFHVEYQFKDGGVENLLVDQFGKELFQAKTTLSLSSKGKKFYTATMQDFRNNSSSVIKYKYDSPNNDVLISEVTAFKDKLGKVLKTEYITPSEVRGQYNAKTVDADGNVKILSSATKDKNGRIIIKKDLESVDGVKTNYEYIEDAIGNRNSVYRIVDKNGEVLLDDKKTFKIIDENLSISTHNEKSYEIKTGSKFIVVQDIKSNKITRINLEDLVKEPKGNLINIIKKVDAEELIELKRNDVKLIHSNSIRKASRDNNDYIKTTENLFVIEHELGHTKDLGVRGFGLSRRDGFKEVLRQETEGFMKAFPLQHRYARKYIDEINTCGNGDCEVVAEANAMLNTYMPISLTAARGHYFQQQFPRTIAYVAKKFQR